MRVIWPIHQLEREHNQCLGVMTIAAVLRQHGIESEVVPADAEAVERRLGGDGDLVLAYSTVTAFSRVYLDLNRRIKESHPKVYSVFGGVHTTYFPEVIEEDGVDAVCIGEGEYPMLELVSARIDGRPATSIANLWVKDGGTIHRNPVRPLIENLDELPLPDHDLFRGEVTRPHPSAAVMTGRGCPYHCTYCFNHVYHKIYEGKGRTLRRRSIDHVMRELHSLKQSGRQLIRFVDDIFILDRTWVLEFAPRYREEIGLPFTCLVRANVVTDEVVQALANAGCYRMMMGIEAGNERIRNAVLKRGMSEEQILRAARIIRRSGIRLTTANILALPGGGLNEDWETVDLNIKARPSYASASVLQAFPGTEIHQIASELGVLQDDNLDQLATGHGFGFATALHHADESEKRQIENLHKFFPLLVWCPWLKPLVRRLIKLPSNRLFEMIYMASVNIGTHLIVIPPRIGAKLLAAKFAERLLPWRRVRRPSAPTAEP